MGVAIYQKHCECKSPISLLPVLEAELIAENHDKNTILKPCKKYLQGFIVPHSGFMSNHFLDDLERIYQLKP